VVDARELEHAAADLRRRRRRAGEAVLLAVAAGAGATLASLLAQPLALPLLAGAVLEALLAARAFFGNRERVARLALEPAAYVLPEVQRYGQRLAGLGQRARLSAWILEMLAEAHLPGNLFLGERVLRFAHELEDLARVLMRPDARVQPASAVACSRLLTHAVESPLYNPRLPADDLHVAVRRIRAGISAA
jgi:hypothetical protein